MGDPEWFIAGLISGLLIGIIIVFIIKGLRQQPASVIFDRDDSGKIIGIHYVPNKLT